MSRLRARQLDGSDGTVGQVPTIGAGGVVSWADPGGAGSPVGALTVALGASATTGASPPSPSGTSQSTGTYSPPTFTLAGPPCVITRVEIAVDGEDTATYQLMIGGFDYGPTFSTGGVDTTLDVTGEYVAVSYFSALPFTLVDTTDGTSRLQFITAGSLPPMAPFTLSRFETTSTAYPKMRLTYNPINWMVV